MKRFKKIYVEITNMCNLNCSFCSKDSKPKKELSLNEFEQILKKIDNYTDYLYLHVKGEPLLHSDFDGILDLCKKYHKKVNITTNGTLLHKHLNIIKNSSVRQINISMHSFKNSNITSILEDSKILADSGIYVVFRFWANSNIEDELISKIKTYYQVYDNKVYNNIYIDKGEEFIWPSLNNRVFRTKGTCLGLKTHIGILSDGTVIPCCLDSSGIINLGNIFNEDLDIILNKDRAVNMLDGFNNNKLCEELCQKCGFKR